RTTRACRCPAGTPCPRPSSRPGASRSCMSRSASWRWIARGARSVATSYQPIPDDQALVMREIARIQQQLANHGVPDAQEMAERTGAAQAYAGESPQHFVDYVEECVRTSSTALREVRQAQRQCWDVYQEREPPNYAAKQEWQSQAVLPKPYAAVQFAV